MCLRSFTSPVLSLHPAQPKDPTGFTVSQHWPPACPRPDFWHVANVRISMCPQGQKQILSSPLESSFSEMLSRLVLVASTAFLRLNI